MSKNCEFHNANLISKCRDCDKAFCEKCIEEKIDNSCTMLGHYFIDFNRIDEIREEIHLKSPRTLFSRERTDLKVYLEGAFQLRTSLEKDYSLILLDLQSSFKKRMENLQCYYHKLIININFYIQSIIQSGKNLSLLQRKMNYLDNLNLYDQAKSEQVNNLIRTLKHNLKNIKEKYEYYKNNKNKMKSKIKESTFEKTKNISNLIDESKSNKLLALNSAQSLLLFSNNITQDGSEAPKSIKEALKKSKNKVINFITNNTILRTLVLIVTMIKNFQMNRKRIVSKKNNIFTLKSTYVRLKNRLNSLSLQLIKRHYLIVEENNQFFNKKIICMRINRKLGNSYKIIVRKHFLNSTNFSFLNYREISKLKRLYSNLEKKSNWMIKKHLIKNKSDYRISSKLNSITPLNFGEKEAVNSPFLFYLELGFPMNVHIKNLILKKNIKIATYENKNVVDVEQHKSLIIICGGYNKEEDKYLKNCMGYDLSNFPEGQFNPLSTLIEARDYHTLVTTPIDLFLIAGYNGKDMNHCECFNSQVNEWHQISTINNPDCCITSSYITPNFIYTFGGWKVNAKIEMLDITKPQNSWKILEIENFSPRRYGCSIQFSDNVWLLGGDCAPLYIIEYNIAKKIVSKTEMKFNSYRYFGSKIRTEGKNAFIVGNSDKVKFIEINLDTKKISDKDISF